MNLSLPDEEAIYKSARLLPSSEARRAFLEQACAGDKALHDRVLALLRVEEEETGFLAGPAIDIPSAEQPGAVIGVYKLLEEIGEGGFGVVFLAEQLEPVRRK